MITKMKQNFDNPMLQIVSINKSDIIVTSPGIHEEVAGTKGGDATGLGFAPDRFNGDDF